MKRPTGRMMDRVRQCGREIETAEQQAVLALHAIRQRRIGNRMAYVNQLHRLMAEFGMRLPRGRRAMLPQAVAALGEQTSPIAGLLRTELLRQIEHITEVSVQRTDVEH